MKPNKSLNGPVGEAEEEAKTFCEAALCEDALGGEDAQAGEDALRNRIRGRRRIAKAKTHCEAELGGEDA